MLLKLIPKPWFRFLVRQVERLGVPGFIAHAILRKHCLEELTLECLSQGFNQVVILGAGFDTLAFRLHEKYEGVQFFEVDFPATQEVKKIAFSKRGLPRGNMKFVPVDFTQEDWSEKLLSHPSFKRNLATIFIAEGVLMYLTEQEVKRILSFMADAGQAKRCVAFTFMEAQSNGSISFRNSGRVVDRWLKVKGEVFRWGIKPEDLGPFLESVGLRVKRIFKNDDFRRSYLQRKDLNDMILAEGEDVCLAVSR
jgi:methyltransferase (TIGR00027 family)